MINVQEIQGGWNRIRGAVKRRWGQLSDDDLAFQSGNVDELVGRIQQKTGETREAIEGFIEELLADSASVTSRVAGTAGEYAQQAADTIREGYRQVSSRAREGYDQAEDMIRERPGQSVGIGFVGGLALGLLVGMALFSGRR